MESNLPQCQRAICRDFRLRQKFHLNADYVLEFDEDAPFLTARQAINHQEWASNLTEWQEASAAALKDHPWEN